MFLGGSLDNNWRAQQVIPLFRKANLSFFDPLTEGGPNGTVSGEEDGDMLFGRKHERAKALSQILLYFVGSQCRGIACMLEVIECILANRVVILVIDLLEPGLCIGDEKKEVDAQQCQDLNQARMNLCDIATRYPHCTMFQCLEDAVQHIVWLFSGTSPSSRRSRSFRSGVGNSPFASPFCSTQDFLTLNDRSVSSIVSIGQYSGPISCRSSSLTDLPEDIRGEMMIKIISNSDPQSESCSLTQSSLLHLDSPEQDHDKSTQTDDIKDSRFSTLGSSNGAVVRGSQLLPLQEAAMNGTLTRPRRVMGLRHGQK